MNHSFRKDEVSLIQKSLLNWYDNVKRKLPWRDRVNEEIDANVKGYTVWVSEIMLQQTQVATVIDYYNVWMKKWPTLNDLAKSDIEEVNKVWSGLGYYSRAKRLLEGAQKVCDKLSGRMPQSSQELEKELPGVGRYTACAIASIAYGEPVGVLDGNVIRVLTRLRLIGGISTKPAVLSLLWRLTDQLVCPDRPGDFNQAMMELGATLCTPTKPQCNSCPLKLFCGAYDKTRISVKENQSKLTSEPISNGNSLSNQICDLEDCDTCIDSKSYIFELGVCNYPQKPKKKEVRQECRLTVVPYYREDSTIRFLTVQNLNKGLLSGLWEFPNIEDSGDQSDRKHQIHNLRSHLSDKWNISGENISYLGDVIHVFSHIRMTYIVFVLPLSTSEIPRLNSQYCGKWISSGEIQTSAMSTAMRKVFSKIENHLSCDKNSAKQVVCQKKRKSCVDLYNDRKQSRLESFFKKT